MYGRPAHVFDRRKKHGRDAHATEMYERRLKIFLTIIFVMAGVIALRAIELQVLESSNWQGKADKAMQQTMQVDTSRGEIRDRNDVRLAYDDPCVDAAVEFGAIALDVDWLKTQARKRLKARGDSLTTGLSREQLLTDEIERVKADIDKMWALLARVSGKGMKVAEAIEAIEVTREEIYSRVYFLHRNAWYNHFDKAKAGSKASPWIRWLVDAQANDPDEQHLKDIDASIISVREQSQAHVILAEIDNDAQVELGKKLHDCPGLELRESTHRRYNPEFAHAASHLLGHVSPVNIKEVKDPKNITADLQHRYLPRDLIGRDGLEGLAEPLLRGTKGQLVRQAGNKQLVETVKAIPGKNVRSSIDIKLQAQILESFKTLRTHDKDNKQLEVMLHNLHGAAVVLDVKTNEVLAMASYPTFDANRFETDYKKLLDDQENDPLLNRATLAHEPGSTVKTIIGAVAVSEERISYSEPVHCTGYMIYLDYKTGKMTRIAGTNRCWVASMFASRGINVADHAVPYEFPHKGAYGNAPGYLVLKDALERSCNIYFQTVADKMHLVGVVEALSRFGLGQKTGIGIPESTGRLPKPHPLAPGAIRESESDRRIGWLAGIGQGQVAATPLQMANVAATFARGGTWMRPKLLTGESAELIYPHSAGDSRSMKLSTLALREVKEGMLNVVRPGHAGTGEELRRNDFEVAGKTGSAQAGKFSIELRDKADGHVVREPDENGVEGKGRPLRRVYEPGTKDHPSELPWYYEGVGDGGQHLAHAWFIGYAPADNPQIAFCVFVEYGGSGGAVAGALARDVVEACVQRHYITVVSPRLSIGN